MKKSTIAGMTIVGALGFIGGCVCATKNKKAAEWTNKSLDWTKSKLSFSHKDEEEIGNNVAAEAQPQQ